MGESIFMSELTPIFYEISYKVHGSGISRTPRKLIKTTIEEVQEVMKKLQLNKNFYDFHIFKVEEIQIE